MTRDEWLTAFASALDAPSPSAAEVDALLEVASIAAHASERQAAPLSCWMLGRAGVAPADALELARHLVVPT